MDTDQLIESLASSDLFRRVPRRTLAKVVKMGREVAHPDGHEVVTEGHGAVGFHMIVAGTARVSTHGTVRRTLAVGDYFGEISVIDGRPRSAGVEAIEGLRTFVIEPAVFRNLLESNPEFNQEILLLLCSRLREAEARLG